MNQPAITLVTPDADVTRVVRGDTDVAAWVQATASRQGITFKEGPIDAFATAASRLSDAEVHLDSIEHLLLALERAGIITSSQGVLLHAAYLRQKG